MSDENEENAHSNAEEENYLEKPMPKQLSSLFGNLLTSGASKAVGAVESGASYIVSPIISPPNVWPDMDNIDNLVNILTMAGYTFTGFCVIGSTYFLTRTARDVVQWRSWTRYRRLMNVRVKNLNKKAN